MSETPEPKATPTTLWEETIYSKGQALNRYPFDQVVSFIYRNYPRSKPRQETRILEIGCGAGNNLWFAAREGFSVTGIDGSSSAVEYARKRFAQDGLQGDFHVGDFIHLPFPDQTFDFVIDRAALTCSGKTAAAETVRQVRRVLIPEGKFFFNPYSDRHSSFASGHPGEDGVTVDISAGTLVGIGPIFFYGKRDLLDLFSDGWKVLSIRHVEYMEELQPPYLSHAEWILIAARTV